MQDFRPLVLLTALALLMTGLLLVSSMRGGEHEAPGLTVVMTPF